MKKTKDDPLIKKLCKKVMEDELKKLPKNLREQIIKNYVKKSLETILEAYDEEKQQELINTATKEILTWPAEDIMTIIRNQYYSLKT
ncbi:MAG: hypothetical protein ACLFN8_04600 [Candidatus Woesearchaeota archaeon]